MCFNSKNPNQTQSTTSAPPWWTNQAQNVVSNAAQFATGDYTPYAGARVAGFNPDQENAFQGVRDTQGIGDPYMQQAGNYATLGAAPVTTQQILDQYNPYIDAQVNQYQQDSDYRTQLSNQQLNSQIAQQSALTGDRGQVARRLAEDSQRRQDDRMTADIRAQGFRDATGIAEGNRDAARSGAGQFSQLGSQAQNLAYTDANALMGTGGLQQQYQQALLDVPYQDYLAAQAKPYEDAQFQASLLGAVQGGAGSTTTKTVPEPSKFSQYLGLGSTLGSMALKAAPFMLSDERAKTDIQEIGKTHDGLPIYSFKMPGDETGGQSTKIGLMAQDVAQVTPEAVADLGGGALGVDYKRATEGAEGMAGGGPVDRFAFASKAGDLGHFQNVDPDLSRMANTLGQAVQAIKKHSGPGAGDYHRGKSEGQTEGHEEGFAKGGEVEKGENRLKGLEKQLQDSQKMLQESERKAAENAARLDAIERTSLADKAQVKGEESGYKSGMKDAKDGGSKKMAGGGDVGLGAMPSPIMAGSLPFKVGSASYVPETKLSPSGSMQGESAPDMPSSGGGMGGDSLGAFKQFGNDALDYLKPKMDMGLNDWAAGTTVTPAGFAAGGSPVDPGTLPFYDDIREVGVGGMGGLDEKGSSYVPETKLVSAPPVPPDATEYTDPVAEEGSMAPSSGLGVPDNTDPSILPQDSSGKPWYASAGDYLGDFGAASMAGESPYGLINVGRALTGANALSTRRLQEEQEQRNTDRNAGHRAAQLKEQADRYSQEFGLKERQQAESERHNKAVEAKGEAPPANVREYLFAKENGFEGGYTDFMNAQKSAESKPAIAKEYEYAVTNGFKGTFQDYQNSRKPDGIPNSLQVDAAKADAAYKSLVSSLDDFEKTVAGTVGGEVQKDENGKPLSGTGAEFMVGQDKDAVERKRRHIQMQMKELYNLGVLNGPDLDLMNDILFDPSVTGGWDKALGIVPYPYISGITNTWDTAGRTRASVKDIKRMFEDLRNQKVKAGVNSPRSIPAISDAAAPVGDVDDRKVINGVNYVKKNGEWFEE